VFNIPMWVRRTIAAAYLLFSAIYFADKYSAFSFFNISHTLQWRLLIIPTLIVAVFMPSAEMMREYIREREHKKNQKTDSD